MGVESGTSIYFFKVWHIFWNKDKSPVKKTSNIKWGAFHKTSFDYSEYFYNLNLKNLTYHIHGDIKLYFFEPKKSKFQAPCSGWWKVNYGFIWNAMMIRGMIRFMLSIFVLFRVFEATLKTKIFKINSWFVNRSSFIFTVCIESKIVSYFEIFWIWSNISNKNGWDFRTIHTVLVMRFIISYNL